MAGFEPGHPIDQLSLQKPLKRLLSQPNDKELIVAGDLTGLQAASDDLKSFCDSINITHFMNSPTRPTSKNPEVHLDSCHLTKSLHLWVSFVLI